MSTTPNVPNEELQAKLRSMVDEVGLTHVSRRLEIGREALARYLANIPMHKSTFLGIESSIASAAPVAPSARASR